MRFDCVSDMMQIYKNQLQQFAQREHLGFPVYKTEGKGPPHLRQFKSTVIVDKKSYGTLEFFPTRKEAEQAAAKVACQTLLVDATQEITDGGLYKNLLQEFAHKRGLCPSYETVASGMDHDRVFVSTVEIGKQTFQGGEAKTKKQSLMNVAKVAYCTLTNGCLATKSLEVSGMDECLVADKLSESIKPPATTKKHQDTSYEDPYLHAKRVKPSTESMDVNTHQPSNFPSYVTNVIYSQVGNSFPVPAPVDNSFHVPASSLAHLVVKRTVENEPALPANTPPPGNFPSIVPISMNSQVDNSFSVLPPKNDTYVPAPAHPVIEQTVEKEPVLPVNTSPPSKLPSAVSHVVNSQVANSLPTPVDPVTERTAGNEPLLDVNALSPSKLPSIVPIMRNSQGEDSLPAPADPNTEQTIENAPLLHHTFKTLVLPQNSNLPVPEGATVMPFSDDQWVAYKIDQNQAPMA